MLNLKKLPFKPLIILCLLAFLLSACTNGGSHDPSEALPEDIMSSSPSPAEPTPTLVVAAAVVNGERIPLDLFENEVERFVTAQDSMGTTDVDLGTAREIVLNSLIDQVLFAQAAQDSGVIITDEDVQERLDMLEEGTDLAAWMDTWGYTAMDLFEMLKLQMLAAYQRDLIVDSVPMSADQVELRQILAFTKDGANRANNLLEAGTPFEDVASEYDRRGTSGYLGWVPRGYLLIMAVEVAAFNLEVGAYSEIIESDVGYHIVMVLDRDERPLSKDARMALQRSALRDWITERRENSHIEVLVD